MELLANELSIHGQFHDISSFHAALERLMAMARHGPALRTGGVLPSCPPHRLSDAGHFHANRQLVVSKFRVNDGPQWSGSRAAVRSGTIFAIMTPTITWNAEAMWLRITRQEKPHIGKCIA